MAIPPPTAGLLWCSECVSAVVTKQAPAATGLRVGLTMWGGTVLCEKHYVTMRGFASALPHASVDDNGVVTREVGVA